MSQQEKKHENFTLALSGLKINPQYPHIGASADVVVSCSCCGSGVVEIKCPFCARDKPLVDVDYLEEKNGKLCLQMYFIIIITKFRCNCLCMMSLLLILSFGLRKMETSLTLSASLQIQPSFLMNLRRQHVFFRKVILTNLLAKTFLAPVTKSSANPDDTCFCKEPPSGEMLQCVSGFCNVQLFHLSCMKVQKPPKRYICPPCRTIINREKREKKKLGN